MAEFQINTDTSLIVHGTRQIDGDCRITAVREVSSSHDCQSLVFGHPRMDTDLQLLIRNSFIKSSDTWLIIPQAFEQLISTTIRVTHLRRALLDTSCRVRGSQAFIADTIQHLEQQFDRSADAGLTIFNVIINEEHEIQT